MAVERELQLIEAARRGDHAAFGALVRPHLATLGARLRRGTAGTELDPQDIVQETLLRSWASIDNYEPRYSFAQFFFGIARYALLEHLRGRGKEIPVAWSDEPDPDGDGTELPGASEIAEDFHAVAGASRFPEPDARTRARHRFLALLSVLLAFGGYPHQQVSFGFGVLLWGKAKQERRRVGIRQRADKVEVTGDPNRVVGELGARPVEESGRAFRAELERREELDPEALHAAFLPFEHRLGLKGGELFAGDASSRALFAGLLDARVGESRLEQYFGRKPERSVAEWCRAVKERVRRHVMTDGPRPKSTLPMPPGDPITARAHTRERRA